MNKILTGLRIKVTSGLKKLPEESTPSCVFSNGWLSEIDNSTIELIGDHMRIDVLYFDGCPSWKNALENLKLVLKAENREAEINLVLVESDEEALKKKFLGSPSIRVNGIDLWPMERQSYFLSCRMYRTAEGMKGFPSVSMLREKIHELQSG